VEVSVVIPAYNCAATIRATLDSVLEQTVSPYEILVMDDGSTDATPSILESYKPRITVFRQLNGGPSQARNVLIDRCRGDLIAFLDSDDLWHPRYLEVQQSLFEKYPEAAATFTEHVVFDGCGNFLWTSDPLDVPRRVELIEPLSFLKRYNATPGYFYPSFCCVPRRVLEKIGREPFQVRLVRAEDCYFYNLLALYGPVVRVSTPLVAYRILEGSLSSDVVKLCAGAVHAFELLEERFRECLDEEYYSAFRQAYAIRRRDYAKALWGARRISEGRQQLRHSLTNSRALTSVAKSLGLLLLTYVPSSLRSTCLATTQQRRRSE
jgi:glycosyltransferase involved in cell wall biosynthesis